MTAEPLVIGPTIHVVGRIPVIGPHAAVPVRPSVAMIGPDRRQVVSIGPAAYVVTPSVTARVEAPPRAAWDDRGWTTERHGREREYRGWYLATHRGTGQTRRFEGRITQHGQDITPYIADPPPEIRRHPKGACFTLTQVPWFQIHWRRAAANVDDALLYVERVLDEALNPPH